MYASSVPITALITVASAAVIRVSLIADHAPGVAIALCSAPSPSANPFWMITATGIAMNAPR